MDTTPKPKSEENSTRFYDLYIQTDSTPFEIEEMVKKELGRHFSEFKQGLITGDAKRTVDALAAAGVVTGDDDKSATDLGCWLSIMGSLANRGHQDALHGMSVFLDLPLSANQFFLARYTITTAPDDILPDLLPRKNREIEAVLSHCLANRYKKEDFLHCLEKFRQHRGWSDEDTLAFLDKKTADWQSRVHLGIVCARLEEIRATVLAHQTHAHLTQAVEEIKPKAAPSKSKKM